MTFKIPNMLVTLIGTSVICLGQISFPTTTLTHALTAKGAEPVQVASGANIFTSANQYPGNGSIGDPTGPGLTILLVDSEAMCVGQVYTAQLTAIVNRGCQGTWTQNHSAGTTVYAGPAWYYKQLPPGTNGSSCVAAQQVVLPWIVLPGGQIWNCTNGQWVLSNFMARAPHPALVFEGMGVVPEAVLRRAVLALALLTSACSMRRYQVCLGDPMSAQVMRLDPQTREDAEKKALFFNAAGGGQVVAWVQRVQPKQKDAPALPKIPKISAPQ